MLIGPSDHLVIEPFKTSLCSVDGVVGSDVDVPIFWSDYPRNSV